jgi:acyl carrier protein
MIPAYYLRLKTFPLISNGKIDRSALPTPLFAESDEALKSELRTHLLQRIPAYMVPAIFVFLPKLPTTISGKIDRKALVGLGELSTAANRELVPPSNPLESELLAIWETVLSRNDISIHDNFFTKGGHSLKAVRIVSMIQKKLNIKISLRNIFKTPTIASLAEDISNALWVSYSNEVVSRDKSLEEIII